MIEVKTSSGKVAFIIDGAGQLIEADTATTVPSPGDVRKKVNRAPQKYWFPCPEPIAHKKLSLKSVITGLDGCDIATFQVGCGGDYIRWIGKDGMGYWDLWRVAGTRVDKAYVGKQA